MNGAQDFEVTWEAFRVNIGTCVIEVLIFFGGDSSVGDREGVVGDGEYGWVAGGGGGGFGGLWDGGRRKRKEKRRRRRL